VLRTRVEVELQRRRRSVLLARRGERGGVCRLKGRRGVRVERQDRLQALETRHQFVGVFLARHSEWGSVCWLLRRQGVRTERQDRLQAVELPCGGPISRALFTREVAEVPRWENVGQM
jgi:hypothetical protein